MAGEVVLDFRKQSMVRVSPCVNWFLLSTTDNEIDVSKLARGMYYVKCDRQVGKVVLE